MGRNWLSGLLGVFLVLSLAWGGYEYQQAQKYRIATENQYHRSLRDFASHLDQIETDLAKSRVASTPNQQVMYLSQVGSMSDSAMKDLAQLPADNTGLNYIGEFLNRAGDFARHLAQKVAIGESPTAEDDKTLAEVHDRLLTVNKDVQELVLRVDTENLAWVDEPTWTNRLGFRGIRQAEAAATSDNGPASSVRSGLDQLNASLQKLPPFSYTGEVDKRSVKEPLGLPSQNINKDRALEVARSFLKDLGYTDINPEFVGVTQGPLGGFQIQQGDIFLNVSKRGGVVTIFRDPRDLGQRSLSPEDAIKKVENTLKKLKWDMVLTSKENFGGYLLLEYVHEKNGIRYYPDKLRLTVALDDGRIVGYDATPFYSYHHERNLNIKISFEQASNKLRQGFNVKEKRLAVIPVMGNREVLAHEFRGTYQDEEYLVYINAETGVEEKIQRIIKTPRGEYLE